MVCTVWRRLLMADAPDGIRGEPWLPSERRPPSRPGPVRITLINFGRWYYDHGSSFMPVMTNEDGEREYHDRLLRQGYEVLIRNATPHEHARMADEFDLLVDRLASGWPSGGGDNGFVSGLGNFSKADPEFPPERVEKSVSDLKARARIEPLEDM